MPHKSHLTTREIADLYGVRPWQVRRAVDAIGADIPRAGLYRLVPNELLGLIEAELRRRGLIPTREEANRAGG